MSVTVEGRTAAIVRGSDGALTFGVCGERFGVGLTDSDPHGCCVEGRLVVAGCAPGGAERVTVIDDAGEEYDAEIEHQAWLVVGDRWGWSESLVRYCGRDGAVIAAVPDGPRLAVEDASERCPVCDAVAWVQVTSEEIGIVCCEMCGFAVGGVGLHASGERQRGAPAKRGARRSQWAAQTQLRDVLARVDWPLYVADERAAAISAVEEDADGVTAVEVAHAIGGGELLCVSAPVAGRRRPAQSIAAGLERFAARQTTERGRSHAAILIGVADIARGIRRQASRVRAQQRPFDIEGVAEPFGYLAIDGKWGARREHDGIEVVLLASDVDPAAITLSAAR